MTSVERASGLSVIENILTLRPFGHFWEFKNCDFVTLRISKTLVTWHYRIDYFSRKSIFFMFIYLWIAHYMPQGASRVEVL